MPEFTPVNDWVELANETVPTKDVLIMRVWNPVKTAYFDYNIPVQKMIDIINQLTK